MRYLVGFVFVLALGVMGCGEATGTGGSGGDGGRGGDGGTGGSGVACVDNVCPCTEVGIRAAVAEGGGPFTFDCDGPTTIATEATIYIDNHVQLDGGGNISLEPLEIFGHSLLYVIEGTEVALSGIALRGGRPITNRGRLRLVNVSMSGVGNPKMIGSIQTYGDLTVVDSEFLEPGSASSVDIATVRYGELTLINSTVQGIWTSGPRALIVDSLVVKELTVSGEADLSVSTEADVVNSTLGMVTNYKGTTRIVNSTMTPGRVYIPEAPAIRGDGQTSVRGSVVVGHCDDEIVSDGYNIESSGDTCGFDQPTDQAGIMEVQLDLGPLQDNGGPTMTHALGGDSVAIDKIPADMCEVDTDQRGFPRDSMCDVGAFEVQP